MLSSGVSEVSYSVVIVKKKKKKRKKRKSSVVSEDLTSICLSQGFYSCTNIMATKQVGEGRVYSAYTSTLLFITKGSQDWNSSRSEAGADAEAMEGCSLLACFPWLAQPALL